MRKLIFVLLGIVFIAVAAAAVIPLVVDVDQYRPQIVELANSRLNGKLELGKLKLSLWGQIRVNVGHVILKDEAGREVVVVRDAYLHLPFASVFGGSPELTFKMTKPGVFVTRSKAGKLNLMTLIKEKPSETQASAASAKGQSAPNAIASPNPEAQTQTANPQLVLPGILARARLSIVLNDSTVSYKDERTDLSTQVEHLNFQARDISLSRPMLIELKADLDTRFGKELRVKGPLLFEGRVEPRLLNGSFESARLELKSELSQLDIRYAELFHKKAGVDLKSEITGSVSAQEVGISKLNFKLFNAEISSSVRVTNQKDAGPNQLSSPSLDFKLQSNSIPLKPWVELVPMLEQFELGGAVQLAADAKGPLDRLGYQARLEVSNLTAKAPKLKAQLLINGLIQVKTDQLETISLTMKAPGNDLAIKGRMISFTAPRLELAVTSSGLDLDQLVVFPKKGVTAPAKPEDGAPAQMQTAKGVQSQPSPGHPTPTADFDALLAPLRENPLARATNAVVTISLASLKAYDVLMTAMRGKLIFKDLQLVMPEFGLKLYDGTVKATAGVNLAPKTPAYQFSSQVSGLDLNKAVAAQFAMLKNTLLGIANFDLAGSGTSFNPDPAIQNLRAKGSMKVTNATFATVDIGKMATEGLSNSIEKISEKIPPLKGKKLPGLSNKQLKYEVVSSDFALADGFFSAPNFIGKAAPNQGIDLKGRVKVGMKDQSLDTDFEVIDTFNLLKARDIAVEQQGMRVEHILAEGNGPVKFPVHIGCKMAAPCYSYTQVPEYLAKVALGNISQGLTGKAKDELKKKAQEALKNAPAPVQKKLEELGKKFKLFN